MASIAPTSIRNIAVVGHKGAGKTTLIEAMLYLARAAPGLTRAENGSVLDDTPEERAHGATLEAHLTHLQWNEHRLNVIDTPGETTLLADTRLALAVADAALLVISARDGVQSGTERVFEWIHAARLPCLVVLTKVDDDNARLEEVAAEARARLRIPIDPMEIAVGAGARYRGVVAVQSGRAWVGRPESPSSHVPDEAPEEFREAVAQARARLVDDVAGMNDALADKYLTDGDLSPDALDAGVRDEVAAGLLVPLYFASGTTPSGITALLDAVVDFVPPPLAHPPWHGHSPSNGGRAETRDPRTDTPLALYVFKTRIDPHAGRVSYVRVLSGVLRTDAHPLNPRGETRERIGQIVQGVGKDARHLTEAVAGDLVALPKLKSTRTGDTLSDPQRPFVFDAPTLPPRMFSRSIVGESKGADEKLATALQRLTEEDPGLEVAHVDGGREVVVTGLGALHLEITAERLRRRAGVSCRLGPPRIAYRETVTRSVERVEGKQKKQTGGHGQFGVCVIDLEPLPRGGGFEFEDAIVGGAIPRQFISSVEKGVVKAMARGVLAGFPMVDLKVRLVDGKSHSVDSSDAAFQVAGLKAFRAAAAAASPVLLQPVVKMQIFAPADAMGELIGDLHGRHGKVLDTDSAGEGVVITAMLPLADTLDYEPRLQTLTQGKGSFTVAFDHYDVCPPAVQERVVRESGYRAEDEEEED